MVAIPETQDPTLEAVDRAIEAKGNRNYRVPSLPMSAVGMSCDRAIWYGFRWVVVPQFDATTLKRFEDGHHGEEVMAARLRLVDGLTLWTIDPDTGKQWEYVDHDGNCRGRVDGVVLGLLQAPKTPHIWEHKQVNEKSQNKLERIKEKVGEKAALREWNLAYWSTAQLYMSLSELDRHYMTVSSPGSRHTISCRTEADPAEAAKLRSRAGRIISVDRAPPRISNDPSWFECRWCEHHAVCHQAELPLANCRTCLSSTLGANGVWECTRWGKELNRDEQRAGCASHLFLPSLIDGEQTDAADDGSWVEYRLRSGETWRNGSAP